MLLQVSNIGDQCYCRRTNAIAVFEHPGAVGTNAIALFEHRGLWGPMLLHFPNIGAVGTKCEEHPTVNGTRWCKRTNSTFQCYGVLRVGGCFSIY